MKKLFFFIVLIAFCSLNEAKAQWTTSGNNIYNTNTGYVGIGNSSPAKLLYVGKNMTEPTITIRNYGGSGGATFQMLDDASGADWKFKATNAGGFKIRDNTNGLDVLVIEPNSATNSLYIKNGGNIGIGTATPANSALIDMASTNKGFLPPRLTIAQISTISGPANGLVVFCTTDEKFYAYLASANIWKEILFGTGTIAADCGTSITINHVAGAVAPVTKTVTYGIVSGVPGEPSKCWITSNLGADHQATSVDDATEASAGWYWQFNRMQGYKHDGTNRTPNTTWITSFDEDSDWQPANDPCAIELGSGWRIPAYTEYFNLDNTGGWIDWNGPWNSALKMHPAGILDYIDGLLYIRGSFGYYYSSSQFSNSNTWTLIFSSGACYMSFNRKAYGMSIRCLRD